MKNLVMTSLIALAASQAAGCIITSGDDTGDAFISATWQIRSEAQNIEVGCPPGFDTAALYNQPVDANGNNAGPVIVDLFDCAAKAGTSAPLPPTTYLTWIEITDHNNTNVYAKSLSAYVDVTVSDKTFNAQILDDGGYFQLSWDLIGAQTNAPLSCASAGVTGGIEAVATEVANPNNFASDIYDCEDHTGITAGYTAGTYTIRVDAFTTGNQTLGGVDLTNKTIFNRNRVTDLGTIQIPINGK